MLDSVHPVLFHLGALYIPSYGAMAALGVLFALALAQRNARSAGIAPHQIWNLCVLALFGALVASRLLLIVMNWRDLLRHPLWLLGLATIHHPLLAAAGGLIGVLIAGVYARWQRLSIANTADVLAAPLALAFACEQFGALLAGSGFGKGAQVPWAITYTNPLAYRWSGAPLGIPLHPVQGYTALAFLTLAVLLMVWLPVRRQAGDVAGVGLMGGGVGLYATEFWRDWEGRGEVLRGALDGPQIAAILLVIGGAFALRSRTPRQTEQGTPATKQSSSEAAHE
ncbi:prolipoprotein diacylglyceryl transferase [Acidobacteria bacterium AB60]|nr:prolipoprotein diacylglyceryl transferase [Acidobacteria bacterium AB60]